MKREKICDKGTQIEKESLACESGLSSDTFAGWKVDVGSLAKTPDWELHPFSRPGSATDFLGELSKSLMALASVFLFTKWDSDPFLPRVCEVK